MASFSQWMRSRAIRRLTWVCGPERVLAEEVIAAARAAADERFTFVAGEDREADIWAACSQQPADPDAVRLIVVRCAQKLRNFDQMLDLTLARDLLDVRVLWHSEEADFPQRQTEDGKELASHLSLLRDYSNAQLIRCVCPEEEPEWVLEWLSGRLDGAGKVLAGQLIDLTAMDLDECANVAAKLSRMGVPATRENIEWLAERSGAFAESVLRGKRPQALALAELMSRDDIGSAIGLLASRLDTLLLLHQAAAKRLNARDTAVKLGVHVVLQRKYKDIAAGYGVQRVAACRTVLAVADDAWRSGITAGIPEVIAVLWAA